MHCCGGCTLEGVRADCPIAERADGSPVDSRPILETLGWAGELRMLEPFASFCVLRDAIPDTPAAGLTKDVSSCDDETVRVDAAGFGSRASAVSCSREGVDLSFAFRSKVAPATPDALLDPTRSVFMDGDGRTNLGVGSLDCPGIGSLDGRGRPVDLELHASSIVVDW